MPVRVTTCGLSGALVLKTSVPLRTPEALGVNVTHTSQSYPWDNDEFPQKLVNVKSPVTEMLLMVRAAIPIFLIFTSMVVPVEPTAADPKLALEGVRTTVDAPEEFVPVPVSPID